MKKRHSLDSQKNTTNNKNTEKNQKRNSLLIVSNNNMTGKEFDPNTFFSRFEDEDKKPNKEVDLSEYIKTMKNKRGKYEEKKLLQKSLISDEIKLINKIITIDIKIHNLQIDTLEKIEKGETLTKIEFDSLTKSLKKLPYIVAYKDKNISNYLNIEEENKIEIKIN